MAALQAALVRAEPCLSSLVRALWQARVALPLCLPERAPAVLAELSLRRPVRAQAELAVLHH